MYEYRSSEIPNFIFSIGLENRLSCICNASVSLKSGTESILCGVSLLGFATLTGSMPFGSIPMFDVPLGWTGIVTLLFGVSVGGVASTLGVGGVVVVF